MIPGNACTKQSLTIIRSWWTHALWFRTIIRSGRKSSNTMRARRNATGPRETKDMAQKPDREKL